VVISNHRHVHDLLFFPFLYVIMKELELVYHCTYTCFVSYVYDEVPISIKNSRTVSVYKVIE